MPSRADIDAEIKRASLAADNVRRGYLKGLAEYTRHDTIIYASRPQIPILPDDIQGFMSALKDLKGDTLDLILHSSGGSSEAAEQIVMYLRSKYSKIRVLVPQGAMSAATMIACAADEIVMGKQSAIGPIDPQYQTPIGVVPAYAILEDFARAIDDIRKDPKTAALWVPKLNQIPLGMISMAETTLKRSAELVERWLRDFMHLTEEQAKTTAEWLASREHKSHGKPIGYEAAAGKNLKVVALEKDGELQDRLLSVFHATMLSLEGSQCVKLIENHLGKGLYMIINQPQILPMGPIPILPPMPSPGPMPPGFPQPVRPAGVPRAPTGPQNPALANPTTPNVPPVVS
jgi:hypothetical protein